MMAPWATSALDTLRESNICRYASANVAGGAAYSLLDLLAILERIIGVGVPPSFAAPRAGDVRHTQADIGAAAAELGHRPSVSFEEGLARTVEWFRARGVSR